jgi:hypothetical protein
VPLSNNGAGYSAGECPARERHVPLGLIVTTSPAPTSLLGQRAASARAGTLWKAYSRGYDLAGRWHTARVTGTIALALVAPIIAFWWPHSTDTIAAVASVWLLVARAVFGPAEDWERRRAVNAQEMFDTYVFELDWNASLAGRPPAEEAIAKAAGTKRGSAPTDWYADTEDLPRPLDVVLSQRSSAAWGRATHFAYAIILASLGAALLVAGVVIGAATHVGLTTYLLRLFLPTVPALLDTIDLSRLHWSTSQDKARIEAAADDLWNRGVDSLSAVTTADCRQLQDQSYQLRLHGPRVATWLYKLRHASDEGAMRSAVAQRIAEYRITRPPG